MGLLGFAAELERKVFGLFRRLFGGGAEPHHLEVRQAILDEVETRTQPIGEGRRAFPYDQLIVHIRAADEDRRYFFESAFVEHNKLRNDITERLRKMGAQVPVHLSVEVRFTDESDPSPDARGFRVEYKRRRSTSRPTARFTVTKGEAAESVLLMTRSNLNVGRMRDVKDVRDLVVRRNDLVFDERDDEVNGSVSRAHAHVWYDDKENVFRLCDDNSAQGTYVFRDGRTLEVHRNSPRGVRLRDGDEIYFGRAVVRFELVEETPTAEETHTGAPLASADSQTTTVSTEPPPDTPTTAPSTTPDLPDLQDTLSLKLEEAAEATPPPLTSDAEATPSLSDTIGVSAPPPAQTEPHAAPALPDLQNTLPGTQRESAEETPAEPDEESAEQGDATPNQDEQAQSESEIKS